MSLEYIYKICRDLCNNNNVKVKYYTDSFGLGWLDNFLIYYGKYVLGRYSSITEYQFPEVYLP